MTKYIFFVSSNTRKIDEISKIIARDSDLKIELYDFKFNERLFHTIGDLIEDKALVTFCHVRHPVLVDHACLYLDALAGLPGPASSLLSGKLSDAFCSAIVNTGNTKAEIQVGMAYTDGAMLLTAIEVKRGNISPVQCGARLFDWDSIFIPECEKLTYSQMSIEQNNLKSPRASAFRALIRKIGERS